MNRTFFLAAPMLALLFAGCAEKSHYVDATDTTRAVLNENAMSSSDWVIAVDQAGQALNTSPRFEDYLADYAAGAKKSFEKSNPGEEFPRRLRQPLLMLSSIKNNTGEHIDTRLLTDRLREQLFNSNRVRFTTYAAGTGQTVDEATGQIRELRNDPNVKKSGVTERGTVSAPDLSMSGSIVKQRAQEGREREVSYTFSLTLTDNRTGEGVWTYTKELKRQSTQSGFGW